MAFNRERCFSPIEWCSYDIYQQALILHANQSNLIQKPRHLALVTGVYLIMDLYILVFSICTAHTVVMCLCDIYV